MVKYRMFHPESDCEFIVDNEEDLNNSLDEGCDIIEEISE